MNKMKAMWLACALSLAACETVEPGEVGVPVKFGEVSGGVLPPGIYVTIATDIHKFSTRTENYNMEGPPNPARSSDGSVRVNSRDGLPVVLDLSVQFHLNGARAVQIYRTYGDDYADNIVHTIVRSAVRDGAAEYSAMDMIDKRLELQQRIETLVRQKLSQTLQGRGINADAIVLENLLMRNLDLPSSVDEAIAQVTQQRQRTATAEQARLTAEQVAAQQLITARGDGAQQVARAQADAETLRIQTEARAAANRTLAASLTPEFLAYERIQATRAVLGSQHTTVFLSNAAMSPSMLMQAPQ